VTCCEIKRLFYDRERIRHDSTNVLSFDERVTVQICALAQGCWRKVIIDDLMPFDNDGNLLLPATSMPHELWPMLLTKALLKVSALELVRSFE